MWGNVGFHVSSLTRDATRHTMHAVMLMKQSGRGSKAITARIPQSEYGLLGDYATAHGKSINSVVSDAIAVVTAEIRRREALEAIDAFQKKDGLRSESTAVEEAGAG